MVTKNPAGIENLRLNRRKPTRGITPKTDSSAAIWTKEWTEKEHFPSIGKSRPAWLVPQCDEHRIMTGIPDARIPIMMIRMRLFDLIFIDSDPMCRLQHLIYLHCGIESRYYQTTYSLFSRLFRSLFMIAGMVPYRMKCKTCPCTSVQKQFLENIVRPTPRYASQNNRL